MGKNIISLLREEQCNEDTEAAHTAGDKILCTLLKELGYGAVVTEYEKIKKWYA